MFRDKSIKRIIYFILVFLVFISPVIVRADDIISTSDVSITAQVNANEVTHGGAGGGINLITSINFSGLAYPYSHVYVLKDGNYAGMTIADQTAHFSISIAGLDTDTYTFSVYAEDGNNRKSSFFSFPIFISKGTTVNVGNIYLSPTIDVDKYEVKKGDAILIFGQSLPMKEVLISVRLNQEYIYKTIANAMGNYVYNLDTSIVPLGKYLTKSRNDIERQINLYATPIPFVVGNSTIYKDYLACSLIRGDLNCDNHVNLIDFSIMAYWYKRDNPLQKIDLNGDGKISLIDFSILAFNWTG